MALKRRAVRNPGTRLIAGTCSVLYHALNASSLSGGTSCPPVKVISVSGMRYSSSGTDQLKKAAGKVWKLRCCEFRCVLYGNCPYMNIGIKCKNRTIESNMLFLLMFFKIIEKNSRIYVSFVYNSQSFQDYIVYLMCGLTFNTVNQIPLFKGEIFYCIINIVFSFIIYSISYKNFL